MPARRNRFRNCAVRVINQMLRRKYLFRSDDIVVLRSEQKHWTVQFGEIDPAAQRDEMSGGQPVFFEQLSHDLRVIDAGQIHGPAMPFAEARLQAAKWR